MKAIKLVKGIGISILITWFLSASVYAQYEANWASLDKRPVPEWFKDAKFGIFITWGVYSVPAYAPKGQYAEWYQNWLENKAFKGDVARYHKNVFGDKTYYDLAKDFKAELFNPDEWATLIEKSGAKYAVPVAKHHDGFSWWPNKYSSQVWGFPWSATEVGPKRDLLGDLFKALHKTSVKAGVYFSWYEWFNPLYKSNPEKFAVEYAIPQAKEMIERYKPAVFWTDGDWNDSDTTWHSTEFLSWLYNESAVKKEIVTYDRYGKGIRFNHGSVYTPEYQPDMEFGDHYFEESRGIGFSYSYNKMEDAWDYNSPQILVLLLSDLVSRGGNLLLNIGPDASGKIPPIMQERLLQIGDWLKINGRAIYSTRKWTRTCQWSEGKRDYKPKRIEGDFKENGDFMLKITVDPDPGYAVKECFFTTNPNTKEVFAILPKWPSDNRFVIKDLQLKPGATIKLLETGDVIKWKNQGNNVELIFPSFNPAKHKSQYAYALSILEKPL
ncbi:alpha-L-fucosidase [Pedobacter riviphilus]|uniref:alpha-L-fucosidase n=1 Tax=Pedobacter riviphilus TaxID=2766984 RepID=A0ABX6TIB2_9SPHI|nr:alpha-L-fucosidase [Pedobacter riviphilus]QNR85267.1 alpha-L-fucosidase [Pedobacter riviphilus]